MPLFIRTPRPSRTVTAILINTSATIGGCLYDYYTLYGVYFDENYTAYSAPIADAIITVDGKETKIRTGKDGQR